METLFGMSFDLLIDRIAYVCADNDVDARPDNEWVGGTTRLEGNHTRVIRRSDASVASGT
jgi:hypothetical protein